MEKRKVIYLEESFLDKEFGGVGKKIKNMIEYFLEHPDEIPIKPRKKRISISVEEEKYEKFKNLLTQKGWHITDFINAYYKNY